MAEKKLLSKEDFEKICRDALPHITALQELLREKGMENMGSLTFCPDGYARLDIYDTGWELTKLKEDGGMRIRHEYDL